MGSSYLVPSYDSSLVVLSLLLAFFASFVALDLARRVHSAEKAAARYWLAGGSIAMGTGIWSMHFVSMLAFSLPIKLGYDVFITFLSWVAAVGVSWIALSIASRTEAAVRQIAIGGLTMGAGICAMHYTGMLSMRMNPGIEWNIAWLATSVAVAVAASFAALLIFFWLRRRTGRGYLAWQVGAAIVMGLAIAGMHYSGMQAARFPAGSICRAAMSLDQTWFAFLIGGSTVGMLIVTLVASVLDARLQSRTATLVYSLSVANKELQRAGFCDALTQLPNRLLLADRLEQAIARSRRDGSIVALMFIDLDGFKTVNDSLGHIAGDRLLKIIADRMTASVRTADTTARLGGDEFVVLVEAVADRTELALLAQRIQAAVEMPVSLDSDLIQLSASIGIAMFPDDASNQTELLARADAAMYSAKAAGKNAYRFHNAAATASADGLMAFLRDLRLAIERNEFQLFYQPKLAPDGIQMLGVEALIRWRHPTRGMIAPSEFISIAERHGLIIKIGAWVVDEACRQMQTWRRHGWIIPVAVNLEVSQMKHPALVDEVRKSLLKYCIEPELLTLELTETGAMDDVRNTFDVLNRLKKLGVKVAIDDFGTGYSSLSYLRRFSVNELKIDRSFVQDLEGSEEARSIVRAVISLAHSLKLRVVAEGVETLSQQEFLAALNCDVLQGFLFARPLPAGELEEKLSANTFEVRKNVIELPHSGRAAY